ncbi:MAG: hypothetical protein JXR78_07245 [Victivallales bacterium]|nr:hypothetical protein [Victivallales bacterium]
MKIKTMIVASTAILLFSTIIFANSARIDVFSDKNNNVELKPGIAPERGFCINTRWGDEEFRKYCIICQTGILSDKWETFSMSFIPQSDGRVYISIKGDWAKTDGKTNLDQNWIYFDNILIDGAILQNGNFCALNSENKPNNWWGEGRVVDGEAQSASGATCAKVWHNASWTQPIMVTKGKEVKITFSVKSGECIQASK